MVGVMSPCILKVQVLWCYVTYVHHKTAFSLSGTCLTVCVLVVGTLTMDQVVDQFDLQYQISLLNVLCSPPPLHLNDANVQSQLGQCLTGKAIINFNTECQ